MTTDIDIAALEAEADAIVNAPSAPDAYARSLAVKAATSDLTARLADIDARLAVAIPQSGLAGDVEQLAAQIEDLLKLDSIQQRTRRAIEVHGKLEVAATEVAKMRNGQTAPSEDLEPLRLRILELTRRLLKEVFTIDA